jgi:AcrR family transcriptional regulator
MVQKKPKRPRGRPRAYDPDEALLRAMNSFWHGGFAGTSLDDLSAATGMKRPSLYAAFGDKLDLYLAALDRYVDGARAAMAEALSEERPLASGLQEVYERALALYFADPEAPLGCFLVATAATESARDERVRARLGAGLRGFARAFQKRFRLARERGEIPPESDPALLGELAGAVLYSIALRARAGDTRASLREFARAAVKHLCGGTAPARGRKRGAPRGASRAS